MEAVNPFVAEVLREFKHAVKSSDDEAFQVKLIGNPEIEFHVQRVMVCGERPCRRSTVDGLKDRCFNFEVAFAGKEVPHEGDDCGAFNEGLLYLRVYDEVDIALPVAHLLVAECIIGDFLSVHLFLFGDRNRPK